MDRRIYLQTMDLDEGELNKSIEIAYHDDGRMVSLVKAFREFASALGFCEGTINKFIVNQYEYPKGIKGLDSVYEEECDECEESDVFEVLNNIFSPL